LLEKETTENDVIKDFSQFPSIQNLYADLVDSKDSKPELGIYCNIPVEKDPSKKLAIILTGFTCAGKDTVLDGLEDTGLVYHVVTATSRPRREKEPLGKYHWLTVRERGEGETEEEYKESIKKEHDLVECDIHYGHVYGLPRKSLLVEGRGIPVVRPDINGTITLHEELPKYGFLPVSIAILPDNWEQIYKVLLEERKGTLEEKNVRLMEDVATMPDYLSVNYFLHNSRFRYVDMEGLERSIKGMKYIIEKYRGKARV
jgi:guanylate kinase